MNIKCKHCEALIWKKEPPGICCSGEKVLLPAMPKPPTPLVNLLEQSVEVQHFLSNTRAYNLAFQMTSFGCDEIKARTCWNPCFKVQGQIYHSIGRLAPSENSTAKFDQISFVGDDKVQSSLRQTVIQGLRPHIVDQLQHMLHQSNSYARSLKWP